MPTNKPEVVLPELPASYGDHCVTDSVRTMREPGYTADQLRAYGRACIDTLTRPADGDFVMVPREATEAMIDAWFAAKRGPLETNVSRFGPAYTAMLSAAPQQHGQEVDEAERLREQMEIVWRYLQKVSPWHASNDMLWCDEIMVGIDLLAQQASQPQQPAEAVAVPVAFVPVHPRSGPLWTETYPRGSESAERLPHYERMPLFFEPPPAIDIGKLRQIAAELRDNAHEHRQEDREVGMLADEQEAQFNEELAERIEAALIGDGGERT